MARDATGFSRVAIGYKDPQTSITATDGVYALNVNPHLAPASGTSAGVAGDVAFDDTYIYVCTSTNSWSRASLQQF